MKILNIESNKIPFLVRIVEKKDTYGLNDCLVHEKEDPLVEFYDVRYNHTPLGQFVSRYYKETLLKSTSGLDLQGGVNDWKVDKEQMDKVRDWLAAPEKKLKLK